MNRFVSHHLPLAIWGTIVGIALTLPGSSLSPISDWIPPALVPWIDKLIHAFVFFVFVVLAIRSFSAIPGLRRPAAVALAVALVYVVALEVAQLNVPGRGFELLDLVAGAVGALLALPIRPRRQL